ncbi:hypothetical protein NC651_000317 [Populus alba x Populus x berolinensis]|nr:hypothetical protein NC651_000317 [Populus alba x Populus x berolinensis]
MYRNYSLDSRKVFTNLKSLDLKLCNHVLPPTSDGGFMMMMKGVLGSNGNIHVTHRVALEIGLLTRETTRLDDPLVLNLNHRYFKLLCLPFLESFSPVNDMLAHFFNGLCSMAISRGRVKGPGLSRGNLFMIKDQDSENENCIREEVWLVGQWESHGTNEMGEGLARHIDMSSATERDVKELLVAFDVDDDMGH